MVKKLLNLFESKDDKKQNSTPNRRYLRNKGQPDYRNRKSQNRNNSRSNNTRPDKKVEIHTSAESNMDQAEFTRDGFVRGIWQDNVRTVSYTHLTLPTNREV